MSSIETSSARTVIAAAPNRKRRRVVTVFYGIACVLATLQFLRAYFVNKPYLDAAQYESGTERMPYQARVLMSYVMREANQSHVMAQFAGHMRGPLHSPDVFILFVVGLLSMALLAFSMVALYRRAMPAGRLAWLVYPLALAIMGETYIVRFQQFRYFPYDLLSSALFALCLYLAYARRYLLLLPVFILACFERETIVMIALPVLLNIDSLPRVTKRAWKEIACAAAMIAIWLPIYLYLNHLYANNRSESFFRLGTNLRVLLNPLQWSQVASAGGFLLLVPLLFWNVMPDRRLRSYSVLLPIWIVVMFAVGMVGETRIYGELTVLVAVQCTIIFETLYVARRVDPANASA